MVAGSPPSLFSDLPRTMARIRRLVRDHPTDRELQRLLHTLLTSMSSDKVDEEAIYRVLSEMEVRCANKGAADSGAGATPTRELPSPARLPPPQQHYPEAAAAARSPVGAAPPLPSSRTPAAADRRPHSPAEEACVSVSLSHLTTAARSPSAPPIGGSPTSALDAAVGRRGASRSAAATPAPTPMTPMSDANGVPSPSDALSPYEREGGRLSDGPSRLQEWQSRRVEGDLASERATFDAQIESMRRRHEQSLAAIRQKSYREARQAQAHHDVAMAQLRRQAESQVAAAAEARRVEQQRAEALRAELAEAKHKLSRTEGAATSLSVEDLQVMMTMMMTMMMMIVVVVSGS